MSIHDKGFATILAVSALPVVIALPLVLRWIPRNVVYGFRTRTTMADDATWYEANAHFGRALLISSLCSAFLAYVVHVVQPFSPTASGAVEIVGNAVGFDAQPRDQPDPLVRCVHRASVGGGRPFSWVG